MLEPWSGSEGPIGLESNWPYIMCAPEMPRHRWDNGATAVPELCYPICSSAAWHGGAFQATNFNPLSSHDEHLAGVFLLSLALL